MANKFKPGDKAYAVSGQMLYVHSVLAKGYLVQDVMYEDCEEEEDQFLEETVYFIEKLYKNPPMHFMHQKHDQLQKDIERYTDVRDTIKADIHQLEQQKDGMLKTLLYDDKYNILGKLINGDFKYYIVDYTIRELDSNVRFSLRGVSGKVIIDYLNSNNYARDAVFASSMEEAKTKLCNMLDENLDRLEKNNRYEMREYTQMDNVIVGNGIDKDPIMLFQRLNNYKNKVIELQKKKVFDNMAIGINQLLEYGVSTEEAIQNVNEAFKKLTE